MDKASNEMLNGPITKNIIKYAIPVILTGVLQLLFNAADLVIVGRYCGSIYVAAVGATNSLSHLVVNFFMGISVGAGVRVAHGIGAADEKSIRDTIHTAIPTAIISGLILTFIGLFFPKFLLELMDTPEDVIDLSALYIKIYLCGAAPNLVYNFGAAILRAAGNTRDPLYYLTFAGILNVCLNIVFVTVFDMDVAGVAIATISSQAASAVLVIRSLMKRKDACKFYPSKMKIKKKPFVLLMRTGIPAGIQGCLFSIANVLIQSSINSFGSVVISGNSAAVSVEGFMSTTMTAVQQSTMNFAGVSYGARKYERIKKIRNVCLMLAAVSGLFLGIVAYVFADAILGIYITDSPEAIKYGILRLTYSGLPYFLDGLMAVMTGLLRGVGAAMLPTVVSVLGICVFRVFWVSTVFRIPAFHMIETVYLAYPISWILTFLGQYIMFNILYKKLIRENTEPNE